MDSADQIDRFFWVPKPREETAAVQTLSTKGYYDVQLFNSSRAAGKVVQVTTNDQNRLPAGSIRNFPAFYVTDDEHDTICKPPQGQCDPKIAELVSSLNQCHNAVREDTPISVAVIDTGLDPAALHRNFEATIAKIECYDLTQEQKFWDTPRNNNDVEELRNTHGTHVAAIIAQVAHQLKRQLVIYSFKVTSGQPQAAGWFQVVSALAKANKLQCGVINLSLGTSHTPTSEIEKVFQEPGPFYDVLYELFPKEMKEKGQQKEEERRMKRPVICCAVGNDGGVHKAVWPARLAEKFKRIIAVGAHDRRQMPVASNHLGARVLALGVGVQSVDSRNAHMWLCKTGSSMATALVSGVHAFFCVDKCLLHRKELHEKNPTQTVFEVVHAHMSRRQKRNCESTSSMRGSDERDSKYSAVSAAD